MNHIEKKDETGNVIYEKWYDGTEYWYDYDANGRLTHEKWSDGSERWYDANGNEIEELEAHKE